jgi:hypothetical protein
MIDTVRILGKTYTITKAEKFMEVDGRVLGQIDYTKQTIKLEDKMNVECEKVTLLHEIMHGVFYQLGFDSECTNEHLIQSIATALYQVLSENKDLLV